MLINDLKNLELSIHPSAKNNTLSGEWTSIDWLGNICALISMATTIPTAAATAATAVAAAAAATDTNFVLLSVLIAVHRLPLTC